MSTCLVDIPEPNRTTSNALIVRNASFSTTSHHFLLNTLELLVLVLVDEAQDDCQADDRQADRCIRATAGNVAWPIALWVHVRAVDGGCVRDAVADGDGAGALDEGTREGVRDPGDDDLVGGDGAHGHLKGSLVVSLLCVVLL